MFHALVSSLLSGASNPPTRARIVTRRLAYTPLPEIPPSSSLTKKYSMDGVIEMTTPMCVLSRLAFMCQYEANIQPARTTITGHRYGRDFPQRANLLGVPCGDEHYTAGKVCFLLPRLSPHSLTSPHPRPRYHLLGKWSPVCKCMAGARS